MDDHDDEECQATDCYHDRSWHDGPNGECTESDCECTDFVD